jgi:hypothetical protein
MAYTIAQLKVDLQGILRGTSLSKVSGPNELISRAGRQVLLDCDPQETKRIAQISNAIYDSVYDYPTPVDLKGVSIIDIRPQVTRDIDDSMSQTYAKSFDLRKENNTFQVQFNSGIKTVRISKNTIAGSLLNGCDSLTANGTWTNGGVASSPTVDTVIKVTGSGSLSFNSSGSGAAYLENSTMTAVDLSAQLNQGSEFLWVYMPDPTQVTSVDLRWGSSSTAYWNRTVTTGQIGAFQTGWNLLRFDWNGSTETGTPDSTKINYVRVTLNVTAANNNFRIDSLVSNLPTIYEMVYYSKYIFQAAGGTWQESVQADSDLINLDTESYNLLVLKAAEMAALNIQEAILARGHLINFDYSTYGTEYDKALAEYKMRYKSEIIQPRVKYYRVFKPFRFGRRIDLN